jgi:hypothetical protein
MSMSSIDTITLAPRSSEASGIVGREQNQVQHMADVGEANFQKNVELQGQRTVESKKSETEDYDLDKSGKKGQGQGKRKKKKKQEEQAPLAPRSNSSFDITI